MDTSAGNSPPAGFVLGLDVVSFAFVEDVLILRDLYLRVGAAESIVLRGFSGRGKSSLLNLMSAVSRPNAGLVRVDRTSVAYENGQWIEEANAPWFSSPDEPSLVYIGTNK